MFQQTTGVRAVNPLVFAATLIIATKCAVLIADRAPLFYLRDSETYIQAAILDLTDNERSYLYGAIVRCFAVWTGSLTVLVVAQALANAATAWLLVYSLIRFLGVRPTIATIAGLALTLDPLQLLQERLVLGETFALLIFASYLVVGLRYLTRPRPALLVLSCVLGITLVAFRVSYVPVALSAIVLLPALAAIGSTKVQFGKHLFGHVALAAAVAFCLHVGYRQLVFDWSGYSGTYQQADGFYMASSWSPKLSPQDALDPRIAAVLAQLPVSGPESRFEMWNRERQRWLEGGLVRRLIPAFDGDKFAANLAARSLALRALRRDPDGIARLAARTYLGFFGIKFTKQEHLLDDQGENRSFTMQVRTVVRERFGLDAGPEYQRRSTAIKRYHLAGGPWYSILALSPLALGIAMLCCRRADRPLIAFLFTQNAVLLAATCFGASASINRYLHPFSFGCLLAFAVLANVLAGRVHSARGQELSP